MMRSYLLIMPLVLLTCTQPARADFIGQVLGDNLCGVAAGSPPSVTV
jgi:hypothetical protein